MKTLSKKMRTKVYERDGYRCQLCGSTIPTWPDGSLMWGEGGVEISGVIHHIDKDRSNNLLSNLVLLCASCHGGEHCEVKK